MENCHILFQQKDIDLVTKKYAREKRAKMHLN